jgi:hypothetical protein
LNERLGRLEERRQPRWVPNPEQVIGTSAVLKSMNAARREHDGLPPDPANEFTQEELAFDRKATRNFLPYLLGERERASLERRPELDGWISEIEAEIAKLDEEAALKSRPKAGARR